MVTIVYFEYVTKISNLENNDIVSALKYLIFTSFEYLVYATLF